jgi:hypothetical protein
MYLACTRLALGSYLPCAWLSAVFLLSAFCFLLSLGGFSFQVSSLISALPFCFFLLVALAGFPLLRDVRCWMLDVGCSDFTFQLSGFIPHLSPFPLRQFLTPSFPDD